MGRLSLMAALLMAGVIGGCSYTTQTTSGQRYLDGWTATGKIDEDIRKAADIEPLLRFPARIGIARLNYGVISQIPAAEAESWSQLSERLGPDFGEFVPISPLLAQFTAASEGRPTLPSPENAAREIRLAAARQHVDVVLVYEVASLDKSKKNGLGFTDVTVLGLFFLPSRTVEIEAAAQALFMDVRNGYPYGTANAVASQSDTSTYYKKWDKHAALSEVSQAQAVENLTVEVEKMVRRLGDDLAALPPLGN